jgi:hypothetical protein
MGQRIYIITNPAWPDYVKVGASCESPTMHWPREVGTPGPTARSSESDFDTRERFERPSYITPCYTVEVAKRVLR